MQPSLATPRPTSRPQSLNQVRNPRSIAMSKSLSALVLAAALATAATCLGDTTWTGAIDNDYHNPGNWNNGVPSKGTPNNNGYIGVATNNPVMITTNTHSVHAIYIAAGVGQQGSLTVDNVDFGSSSAYVAHLELGGSGGTGVFTQTGASARTYTDWNFIGRSNSGAVATMNILGGQITGSNWRVGGAGTGTLNLANATLTVRNVGSRGSDEVIVVGGGGFTADNGAGTFNIGDADHPGTVTFQRSTDGQGTSVMVRNSAAASGTLRGWGTITTVFGYATDGDPSSAFGGTLTNNGRVIADGYGLDRDLDLTNTPRGIRNTITNGAAETNGWYAQDGGRILLPAVDVAGGNSTVNLAEDPSAAQPSLVNSLQASFVNATAGTLQYRLLALDRADLPATPFPLLNPIGVWDLLGDNGLAFDSATLTFRYDQVAAGANESLLNLFHYTGGQWVLVPSTLDLANHRLTAVGVTSFSHFAIAEAILIPEPASLALLGLGGLLARRRRQR